MSVFFLSSGHSQAGKQGNEEREWNFLAMACRHKKRKKKEIEKENEKGEERRIIDKRERKVGVGRWSCGVGWGFT